MNHTPRLMAMGGLLFAFAMTACSSDTATEEDTGQVVGVAYGEASTYVQIPGGMLADDGRLLGAWGYHSPSRAPLVLSPTG